MIAEPRCAAASRRHARMEWARTPACDGRTEESSASVRGFPSSLLLVLLLLFVPRTPASMGHHEQQETRRPTMIRLSLGHCPSICQISTGRGVFPPLQFLRFRLNPTARMWDGSSRYVLWTKPINDGDGSPLSFRVTRNCHGIARGLREVGG